MRSWMRASRAAVLDLGVARVGPAIGDVVAHRDRKDQRRLQHHGDLPAQRLEPVVAHIDAVDQHRARARIEEARQQTPAGSTCRRRSRRRSRPSCPACTRGRCRAAPASPGDSGSSTPRHSIAPVAPSGGKSRVPSLRSASVSRISKQRVAPTRAPAMRPQLCVIWFTGA